MDNELHKEFRYFVKHHKELAEKYRSKFVVIKDEQVIGAYDLELEAITETSKKHDIGTFLVQKCESGTNSYTQTFHSRIRCRI